MSDEIHASNGKRSHAKRIEDLEKVCGALRNALYGGGYSLNVDGEEVKRLPVCHEVIQMDVLIGRIVNMLVAKGIATRRQLGLKEEESRIVVPGRSM